MKLDSKTIVILILAIALLSIGSIYAYSQITIKFYNLGVQDTINVVNAQILNSLQQSGYMTFVFELNNATYKTNLYPTNVTKI